MAVRTGHGVGLHASGDLPAWIPDGGPNRGVGYVGHDRAGGLWPDVRRRGAAPRPNDDRSGEHRCTDQSCGSPAMPAINLVIVVVVAASYCPPRRSFICERLLRT